MNISPGHWRDTLVILKTSQRIIPQLLIGLMFVLSLSHCGSLPPKNSDRKGYSKKPQSVVTIKNPSTVQRQLQGQYEQWRGVGYRLGGTSKKGVDCSAFVRAAMSDGLKVQLPRTTELQSSIGKSISKSQLRPGDLVFFKTGFFKKHVGIYLGDEIFIHASTSKGVMKSNVNSSYWKSHYWHSRRVM